MEDSRKAVRARSKGSLSDSADKTIVVRDRRKPNQYTTNNVIAREWLPILRVGDAFFFYSIYLSMANRETESSWGSLRTQAKYLQCGVDLIIRGNKLLEICELIYIDTGNQRTTNEYYILEPPPLTPELKARIHDRLDAIAKGETSVNWQSWVKQVRKALGRHRSLPSIWAERRSRRGGRPVKAVRAQSGVRESQPPNPEQHESPACGSQAGDSWPTSAALVAHNQAAREAQPEQDVTTSEHEQVQKRRESTLALVQEGCYQLGIAPAVVDIVVEQHSAEQILQQLNWLSFRNPRDPAALLVSAVQGDWERPIRCPIEEDPGVSERIESPPMRVPDGAETSAMAHSVGREPPFRQGPASGYGNALVVPGIGTDARAAWDQVKDELRMQMTRATFDTWLGGTRVVDVSEAGVTVLARDAYAAEWLQARWRVPIRRTMSGILGQEMDVLFVAPDGQGA